ncbi:MAG: hypothetical protein HPY44_11290 [Armatimonadetes bacterium]|nr:hypothetical protein [Armatimonadota bacterium]
MQVRWLLALLVLTSTCFAAPLRIVDITGDADLVPLSDAFADLGERATVTAPGLNQPLDLGGADVLVIDGETDLDARSVQAGALEAFVRNGGGLLIAGMPATLSKTTRLWQLLGDTAPANVVAADLFPDNSGDWMWTGPQAGETPDHIRHIRKTITVAKPVRRAYIRTTADNLYWVYVNGEQVGYHWSWYDLELWNITDNLKQGKNVIAFKARNVDGPGGFYAQVGIEYEDGTRELIASDRTWKFHIPEEQGWNTVEFDDEAWQPAREITPFAARGVLPDRGSELEGELSMDLTHPVFNAIADRFGPVSTVRDLDPKPGSQVLARVAGQPVLLARELGQGRVLLINTVGKRGGIGTGEMADDLLCTSLLWLGKRAEPVRFGSAEYLPETVPIDGQVRPYLRLLRADPQSPVELRVSVEYADRHTLEQEAGELSPLRTTVDGNGLEGEIRLLDYRAEGTLVFTATMSDEEGNVTFRRDWQSEATNPVNIALSVPGNRTVTAEGFQIDFAGTRQGDLPEGAQIVAWVEDPSGRELARIAPAPREDRFDWSYRVPNLAEGEYRLRTRVSTAEGKILDESALTFHVVPRLDLGDFYPTTMRLSPFSTFDQAAIEAEIEAIIAHGFNTLTFSGRRLRTGPNAVLDFAEDYAQRRGMAVSYSFQGDFSLLNRDTPPPVSVYSPEYSAALRPVIEKAVETCRRVPRLLNVQGYMDEPFQVGGNTFDDRPPAREEFRRRYGIEMPTREEAMKDPALWLKYVDFWSDGFAAGWRQSYAMVKELYPDFWVELTHDSHNTFGAAGNGFRGSWAVDDVFHWGAPFDSVNYDIYPYLSTDFRRGKFRDPMVPRIAGIHMAFAQMRNLAYTYEKKLGFWVESGWGGKLAPESDLRRFTWSPRELTYTAIAAGCDYLNTFWGIPEDPRWWQTHGETMNEVKAVAPLLTRSKVPQAKAAFLFPRTQHVLLQEEYWNVMVALEAFRRAYGDLDCIHEDQLAQGKLDQYAILCLFDVHLMKRASAETIRAWCEKGGFLLADEVPSLDELKRPLGIFEQLFGVTGSAEVREGPFVISGSPATGEVPRLWGLRSYTSGDATPSRETAGGAPVWFQRQAGEGSARLLNLPLKDCYFHALAQSDTSPDAAGILGLINAATAGMPAPNVASNNPEIEAAVRQTEQGTTLLFVINHEGQDPVTTVQVNCAPPGCIARDLVSGERVATEGEYRLMLECPWGTTRLIGLFPSDPSGVAIVGLPETAQAGETVAYTVEVGGGDSEGNHLLDITVAGPDGQARLAFSGRTCTENGRCERNVRLPINAQPGTWTVLAKSLWDGSSAQATFQVRESTEG